MQVKIYREVENEGLILDEIQLQRYHELTNKLGLKSDIEENVPNVYIRLNNAMQKQLLAVCPVSVDLLDYSKSTIPLEVLEVLDFCKENSMYEGYKVLYNDVEPDPMILGWNYQTENDREKQYTWRRDYYLIARWGDCSVELEELLKLGYNILLKELASKAKLALERINSIVKSPDIYVDLILKNDMNLLNIDLQTSGNKDIR